MEKRALRALALLATCPGKYTGGEECSHCPCLLTRDCCEKLHQQCHKDLHNFLELNPATSKPDAPQKKTVIITQILRNLGMPAHIIGYQYTRKALEMVVAQPELINNITKGLYPQIAAEFGSTSSRVERAIRHAVEVTWDRGDPDVLQTYFGFSISSTKGKPTNSEFIAMIADNIRLNSDK